MNLVEKQLSLIKFAKNYINIVEKSGVDVGTSSLCFLNSWYINPGYAKIKLKSVGFLYIGSFILILLKNFLSIAKYFDYYVLIGKSKRNNIISALKIQLDISARTNNNILFAVDCIR